MYFADHWPPHFHGEYEALSRIDDLRVIAGDLPARVSAPV
jgi:Domain of unknown function (DUF4160)